MKKIRVNYLLFLLLSMLLITVLIGCSNNTDTTGDSEAIAEGAEGAKTEESSENNDESYNLKMNVTLPPSQPGYEWEAKYKTTEQFADMVEERTAGRVTVDLYYSSQLASDVESLDALSSGTIDLYNGSILVWADKIPEANFVGLPFWSRGEEHAFHIIRETDVGTIFEEKLENYGVKPLIYWPVGISGYMSTEPIASPDDFKGLIFNNASGLTKDFYTEMGAGLATVPYAEQYEGLLRNTIDVVQFSVIALDTYKLHEVVDYVTLPTTLAPGFSFVGISNMSWEKLPSDMQEIIMEVALEVEKETIEASKRLTEEAITFAEENDIEIIRLTEENFNQFVSLSQELVWGQFSEINESTEKMAEVLKAETEKFLDENPEAREEFEQFLEK